VVLNVKANAKRLKKKMHRGRKFSTVVILTPFPGERHCLNVPPGIMGNIRPVAGGIERAALLPAAVYFWQRGQKNVARPAMTFLAMVPGQLRQASPCLP
jgi:hypothetical protein